MAISQVDLADDRAYTDWYGVISATWIDAWPGDPLWAGPTELRDLLLNVEYDRRVLLIDQDLQGEVTGAAEVGLPQKENLHIANVEISVHPSCRGRGIGRALLEQSEEIASANGRSVLLSVTYGWKATLEARDARFATAAGYAHARTEVRRELQLPVEQSRIDTIERAAAGAASDYELVSWWRRCPDELVESRARLASTLTADEPHGDLDVEAGHFDVERVRRWEQDMANVGRDLACTGAVRSATGELAAVTDVGMPRPGEDLAMQFTTVVSREDRGHRLGILVKAANLKMIAGHASMPKRISTWNAESNEHMIRVNEEMGFTIAGRAFNWQKVR
jgi:GNAT superfamily N-acetyltransferase